MVKNKTIAMLKVINIQPRRKGVIRIISDLFGRKQFKLTLPPPKDETTVSESPYKQGLPPDSPTSTESLSIHTSRTSSTASNEIQASEQVDPFAALLQQAWENTSSVDDLLARAIALRYPHQDDQIVTVI